MGTLNIRGNHLTHERELELLKLADVRHLDVVVLTETSGSTGSLSFTKSATKQGFLPPFTCFPTGDDRSASDKAGVVILVRRALGLSAHETHSDESGRWLTVILRNAALQDAFTIHGAYLPSGCSAGGAKYRHASELLANAHSPHGGTATAIVGDLNCHIRAEDLWEELPDGTTQPSSTTNTRVEPPTSPLLAEGYVADPAPPLSWTWRPKQGMTRSCIDRALIRGTAFHGPTEHHDVSFTQLGPLDHRLAVFSIECTEAMSTRRPRLRPRAAPQNTTFDPLSCTTEQRRAYALTAGEAAKTTLRELHDATHSDGDPGAEAVHTALEGLQSGLLKAAQEHLPDSSTARRSATAMETCAHYLQMLEGDLQTLTTWLEDTLPDQHGRHTRAAKRLTNAFAWVLAGQQKHVPYHTHDGWTRGKWPAPEGAKDLLREAAYVVEEASNRVWEAQHEAAEERALRQNAPAPDARPPRRECREAALSACRTTARRLRDLSNQLGDRAKSTPGAGRPDHRPPAPNVWLNGATKADGSSTQTLQETVTMIGEGLAAKLRHGDPAGDQPIHFPPGLEDVERVLRPTETKPRYDVRHENQPALLDKIESREVADLLKAAGSRRAPGPSGLTYDLLKDACFAARWGAGVDDEEATSATANVLALLTAYLDLVRRHGAVPDGEHAVTMIALPKNGNDATNVRPIALLEVTGKLLDLLLVRRLQRATDAAGVLHRAQHGFVRNRRCAGAILLLRLAFEKAADRTTRTRRRNDDLQAALLDWAGAYDSVSHSLLRLALERVHIPPKVIGLIMSRACHNVARVRVGDTQSAPFELQKGVPQGSPLSPFLFVLVLDPLLWMLDPENMPTTRAPEEHPVLALADDLAVLAYGKGAAAARLLAQRVEKVARYGYVVGMELSPKPEKQLIMSSRPDDASRSQHYVLRLKDQPPTVTYVDEPAVPAGPPADEEGRPHAPSDAVSGTDEAFGAAGTAAERTTAAEPASDGGPRATNGQGRETRPVLRLKPSPSGTAQRYLGVMIAPNGDHSKSIRKLNNLVHVTTTMARRAGGPLDTAAYLRQHLFPLFDYLFPHVEVSRSQLGRWNVAVRRAVYAQFEIRSRVPSKAWTFLLSGLLAVDEYYDLVRGAFLTSTPNERHSPAACAFRAALKAAAPRRSDLIDRLKANASQHLHLSMIETSRSSSHGLRLRQRNNSSSSTSNSQPEQATSFKLAHHTVTWRRQPAIEREAEGPAPSGHPSERTDTLVVVTDGGHDPDRGTTGASVLPVTPALHSVVNMGLAEIKRQKRSKDAPALIRMVDESRARNRRQTATGFCFEHQWAPTPLQAEATAIVLALFAASPHPALTIEIKTDCESAITLLTSTPYSVREHLRSPVRALYEAFRVACRRHGGRVRLVHVKGHSNQSEGTHAILNHMADQTATMIMDRTQDNDRCTAYPSAFDPSEAYAKRLRGKMQQGSERRNRVQDLLPALPFVCPPLHDLDGHFAPMLRDKHVLGDVRAAVTADTANRARENITRNGADQDELVRAVGFQVVTATTKATKQQLNAQEQRFWMQLASSTLPCLTNLAKWYEPPDEQRENATSWHLQHERSTLNWLLKAIYHQAGTTNSTCVLCNDKPDDPFHFATCPAHPQEDWKTALSDACATLAGSIGKTAEECKSLASDLHTHIQRATDKAHLRLGLVKTSSIQQLSDALQEVPTKVRPKFLRVVLIKTAHSMWRNRQTSIKTMMQQLH